MAIMMGHNSQLPNGGGRMYAIVFDFDTTTLEATYGSSSWRNAYQDVCKVLEKYGFECLQDYEAELSEGERHSGRSALIGLVAQRRMDAGAATA